VGRPMGLQDRVSHRLKLRDLRLLLALDEWGSMAKAAAHLNLTQSAVSKAIAELEHTFGVRLFDRTPKGIDPTPYGRALLKGGAAVFDELRQSVNAIEHLADPTVGELRLGCTEPMSWGIVPTIINQLVQQHPRLIFRVMQADPGIAPCVETKPCDGFQAVTPQA
jgi:DNA-binding transcriptional LysR family regulator